MSAPVRSISAPASRRAIWGCGGLLALAAFAAYCNTFKVPFLLDDLPSIRDNATIRHLWPIWQVLLPPVGHGLTVCGRPILNLSLAVNYAVSGFAPWSYHVLNLLVHIFAGLALFGLVRRTLELAAAAPVALPAARRWLDRRLRLPGGMVLTDADLLALGGALLWLLHPLQTEAVTYVIQRTESMMALFFLLTLYCFARALRSPHPRRWQVLTIVACLLSVGTKEVSATIPVLVFLYDRTFVAGTFAQAWRRRRWLHLALAATWLPLLGLVASTGWNRGGTAGFNVGVAPWAYWFTQFEAVVRYLHQTVWPHPLVFDYGTFYMTAAQAAPYALIVVPLALATLYALWRHPVPGFLGGWFFAILAPTSIIPGTIQMIVEHRMYLPLAAVIVLVVGTAALWWPARRVVVLCLALAVPEGWLTLQRNRVYQSDLSLWSATAAHSPASVLAQGGLGDALYQRGDFRDALFHYEISSQLNPKRPKVHYNLGVTLLALHRPNRALAEFAEAIRLSPRYTSAEYESGIAQMLLGRPDKALPHFQRALQISPEMAEAQYECGVALARLGRPAEAIPHYRKALQLGPGHADVECDLGVALYRVNRLPEAVACFQRALRLQPDLADAHFNLGLTLAKLGRTSEALEQYADAARLAPNHAKFQFNLGLALAQSGRLPEAVTHFRRALQARPNFADAHFNLGLALARMGQSTEALAQYADAARLSPNRAEIQLNLGIALAEAGRKTEALDHLEKAVHLKPAVPAAHCNLGVVLAETGRLNEAVSQFEEALRLRPDYVQAHYNLGNALLQLRRVQEARRHFQAALRINPRFKPAREMLERLQAAPSAP